MYARDMLTWPSENHQNVIMSFFSGTKAHSKGVDECREQVLGLPGAPSLSILPTSRGEVLAFISV